MRAPNRRLTRPRSHNRQAVTVECQPTRQAQWSHECASDDKTRPGTYQRFVEALVLRVTLFCTRRRPSPRLSAAVGRVTITRWRGCFDFGTRMRADLRRDVATKIGIYQHDARE